MSKYELRRIRVDEGAIVAHHRMRMFDDMNLHHWDDMQPKRDDYIEWVSQRLANETYIGYFLCDDDAVIAGAGLWLMDWSTHPISGTAVRGMIFNVYTEPNYRRQGLARQLVNALLDWCKDHQIQHVALHASDEGRPLYKSLGFQASNEMQLYLGD